MRFGVFQNAFPTLNKEALISDKTKLTKEFLKLRHKGLAGADWAKEHATENFSRNYAN